MPNAPRLTLVAEFDHQVTGVAVVEDGRRFVNFPRWTDDTPISVAEVLQDGSLRPYPDERWNSWRNAKANELDVSDYFVCAQSIVPDGRGNLWVLDEKILEGAPKLVRIDLERFPSLQSRGGIHTGSRVGFKVAAGEEAGRHDEAAVGGPAQPGGGCG